MYRRALSKLDGRELILYSRGPIADDLREAPSPSTAPYRPDSHLRWHPLRGEWVVYATGRQDRTFLPPAEYNPLAPMKDPRYPTELPAGAYDAAVFQNLFPAFSSHSHDPPASIVPTRPGLGACEVVVFTQDADASLGRLPLDHIELICEIWGERYRALGDREDVLYVFPFENRGVEVGVTLRHPHGQIYAYPFVPPVAVRELSEQRAYMDRHGRGLLESHIAAELEAGERILYRGPHAVAFVPACARHPYEVWLAPLRAVPSIDGLDPEERADFARALKTLLLKYDGLWQQPMPYLMVFHQAPTDGHPHPEAHLHVEFYPAYRMKGRLKYLAGSEIGAGVFTADTLPEETARALQAVEVRLD